MQGTLGRKDRKLVSREDQDRSLDETRTQRVGMGSRTQLGVTTQKRSKWTSGA
jgi:hypothetical protein